MREFRSGSVGRDLCCRSVLCFSSELGFAIGVGGTAGFAIRDLQLVVYIVKVGIRFDRGFEVWDCILGLALLKQRLAELVLCIGIVGIELQFRFELGHGY